MAKKRDAAFWRNYRARRRQKTAQDAAQPQSLAQPATVEGAPRAAAPVPRSAAPGPSAQHVAQPPAALTRRRRVKSDKEIEAHIANAMRSYGHSPRALLNVLKGLITQLQDDMKREREETLADRVCEQRHPGRLPAGIYCKSCHEVEMAGKFGGLPPEFAKAGATVARSGELTFPNEVKGESEPLSEDPLDDIHIKPMGD